VLSLFIHADHSIASFIGSHLIDFQSCSCNHSIDLQFWDHSIDSPFLSHSIGSVIMPVITQSMAKHLALSDLNDNSSSIVGYDTTASSSSTLLCIECSLEPPLSLLFQIPRISKFRIFKREPFFLSRLSSTSSSFLTHHNLESVNLSIMKLDCGDPVSVLDTSPGMSNQDDIVKLLTAISSQMMQNYQDIQERLNNTELRLSQEINRLPQDHEDFKLETRSACQLITGVNPVPLNNVSVGNNVSSGNIPVPTVLTESQVSPSTSSVSQDSSDSAVGSMPASSPVDFQLQMMTMLTDTFSK
jgi:hypothetical protein